MNTKTISMIGIISALSLLLGQFTIYKMPQGGSITLYLLPLFLYASNAKIKDTIICGIVISTLDIIFGGYVLGPIQVMLDYYIPISAFCLISLFKNKYIGIILGFIIALFSYTISGVIYYETELLPSLIYNATFFVPTIIATSIIYYFIYPRIKNILN